MYAFRKPFTAASYEGLMLGGLSYKSALIIVQLIGYTMSKFLGVRVISGLQPGKRLGVLALLMACSAVALLLFACTPPPYNAIWMFANGIPLGMVWGIVFSFMEGRRNTELLGAVMASSFVVASGAAKAAGLYLMETYHVPQFWMPLATASLFSPLLLLGMWMLNQIPAPDEADKTLRHERTPMSSSDRKQFFRQFAPGILLTVLLYTALTIFRDFRDNFMVELVKGLGYASTPQLLMAAELPVALLVLAITSAMVFIRNNRISFYLALVFCLLSGVALLSLSGGPGMRGTDPVSWLIAIGFAVYLPYIAFHTMLFERWMAHFKVTGNLGFLMYVADSAGYLGSVLVLLYRNFGSGCTQWLPFFTGLTGITGATLLLSGMGALVYFRWKERENATTDSRKQQKAFST
ncbi:MAG: hypothetical protein EBZ77_13285 [Chitinophagia bacterium]|nr:hypothetical protein [Chitinophagia bacterium]